MRRFVAPLTVVLLLVTAGTASATIQTGFESPTYTLGTVNGRNGWDTSWSSDPTTASIVGSPVKSGTQALQLADTTQGDVVADAQLNFAPESIGPNSTLKLTFDANFASGWWTTANQFKDLIVTVYSPSFDEVMSVSVFRGVVNEMEAGAGAANDGGIWAPAALTDGDWHNLSLVANNGTGQLDLIVDNVTEFSGVFTPG